ncbi:MAG: DsrE family protein [Candidatus Eremiobacteraeota bacterium]|nr:DsrE family protein [Candidatus Eremiobacteraeota bacterium]
MGERTVLPPTFAEKDLNYYLRMVRGDFSELEELQTAKIRGPISVKNIVIVFHSTEVGIGKKKLGEKLLQEFLQALVNSQIKPKAVILFNSAVNLAAENEQAIGRLIVLEEQGCKVMVCVSSADEYGVSDRLKVGFVAHMDDICEQMLEAWKVISL